LGAHKESGFSVAIKEIAITSEQSEDLKNEIDILKKCKHPNIVTYFGSLYRAKHGKIWVCLFVCLFFIYLLLFILVLFFFFLFV
jgi:serine/threonine protein kinase